LYDKELAHKANVNNLSLINNELHKQANVVCEIDAPRDVKIRENQERSFAIKIR
jgi:hypothetical protein